MTTSISYADVEKLLKAYYEKEYEGYSVEFVMEDYKTQRWASGWDDYSYDVTEKRGKLTVHKTINGLNNNQPLSFERNCSEKEMRTILEALLGEIFGRENYDVWAIYFKTDRLELSLNKRDVKKLVLSKNN